MKLAAQRWTVVWSAAVLAAFGSPHAGFAQGGFPSPARPANPPIKLPPIPPGVPTTPENCNLPTEAEVRAGREAAVQVERELKVLRSGTYYDRLQRIAKVVVAAHERPDIIAEYKRLYHMPKPDDHSKRVPFEWRFTVIDDKHMINAFTLPGGPIYVSRGLMDLASDDELAAVLGHECTHAAFHHSIQEEKIERKAQTATIAGMVLGLLAATAGGGSLAQAAPALMMGTSLVSTAALTGFSRTLEAEADRVGVLAIRGTQYTPVAMLTFMEKLENEDRIRGNPDYGIYADHPYSNQRVASITKELQDLGYRVDPAAQRLANGSFRVKVVPTRLNDRDVAELQLDGHLMFVVADSEDDLPPLERGQKIAERMERAFAGNLTDSDVTYTANTVSVGGIPMIRVLPDDAAAAGGTEKAVSQAYRTIVRAFLTESLKHQK